MNRVARSFAIIFFSANFAAAYEPGDQLVVVRPVEMKTITGSTHQLTPGTPVTVRGVEGGKLRVAAPRVGWIESSTVIAAKDAVAYFSEELEKGADKAAALLARGKVRFNRAGLMMRRSRLRWRTSMKAFTFRPAAKHTPIAALPGSGWATRTRRLPSSMKRSG